MLNKVLETRVAKSKSASAGPKRTSCVIAVAVLLVLVANQNLMAQGFPKGFPTGFPNGFPDEFFKNGMNGQFNPQAFMEQMFGAPSEEEAAVLERIEIKPRDETRYGKQLFENFRQAMKNEGVELDDSGPAVEYMEELVKQLKPQMTNSRRYRNIKVYVANSDETDARSFPGGILVFNRGMIQFCESQAAIMGVVGHELSHLDRGHQLLPLKRSKLAEETFQGGQGFSPQAMMKTFSVMSQAWMRPFRPEDETEADLDATAWLWAVGSDPRELAKLFIALKRKREPSEKAVPTFLRTHPYDEDRFETIMKRYEELAEREPDKEVDAGKAAHREKLADIK